MPSLQCPECRREILPGKFAAAQEKHILCGLCGREIYENVEDYPVRKCPKCDDAAKKEEFNLAECCCQ